jgi:hypothetical protein
MIAVLIPGQRISFPRCWQADMARSGGSIYLNAAFSMRFHTADPELSLTFPRTRRSANVADPL